MQTSVACATFFVLWFITLFAVLPFFAQTQEEAGDVVPGTPESAPPKILIWKFYFLITIVPTIAFVVFSTVIASLGRY
jgi:predicted secreted protein